MIENVYRTVRVAAVQLAATEFSDAQAALAHTLEMIGQASEITRAQGSTNSGRNTPPRLIVLPEVTYPAYVLGGVRDYYVARVKGTTLNPLPQLCAAAKQHGIHLVIGLATS